MSQNLLLMNEDTVVMEINFDDGLYHIRNAEKMPYQLKDRIVSINDTDILSMERKDLLRASFKNQMVVSGYFASRVLPLTRENAKKIYSLFGFEQMQDDYSKMKIAILCRAVSLQDNYWIKNSDDKTVWDDINLRNNHLNEVVAQVSLHGSSLTLQGQVHTPELNGQGAYAKAWKREEDGLYLYKIGSDKTDYESRIEVMVSNLLDKTNVSHVRYLPAQAMDRFACKCKCMTTDTLSILAGMDFRTYCNVHDINAERELLKLDSDNLYKMWITDYLISNRDRHGMNWGLYYDNRTMQLLGLHPLFDHNNAFDTELMKDKDAPYLYDNSRTMRECAKYAIKRTDYILYNSFSKSDFLSEEMYESFMDRASELGIKVKNDKTDITNSQSIHLEDELYEK